ncbi:MAG: ribosomal protein S18 acetylase RimI-like enzyme [Natrialbaceae archaeon]|jgi:ribosomal protein S18 acetylase RimI-like enzyme
MDVRPYDAGQDRDALWELKRGFELGLGEGTGNEEKQDRYAGKLTADYRERYLKWVDRCVSDDERCLTVAADGTELAGYVFVLPERLAMIWDAAVLNEIFVGPEHRGSGVADDLMAVALEVADDQALPLDRIVLDVDRENERAKAFYRRYDFEHWGEMVARKLES